MAKPGIRILTLEKQLGKIIEDAKGKVLAAQVDQTERVLESLIFASPIFTGYYASNHRIILRSAIGQFTAGGIAKLVPQSKPEGTPREAFVGNIGPAFIEEISKLSRLKLGDVVVITTRVPYADEVERNHGVYSGVAAVFGAT